jgi:hypothetical protein
VLRSLHQARAYVARRGWQVPCGRYKLGTER